MLISLFSVHNWLNKLLNICFNFSFNLIGKSTMTCKSWHPWYTFGGLEQGYWCCFAGGINQKFSSVCDASCLCQWLSRCKNSTVFEGCIFKPHDFTLQMPISAHEDPHSLYYLWCHWFEWSYTILTPTTRAGKRDLSWAWIRQIGQRKNAKWTSKIDQKIDYLPIHVPCTFYWKSINSQPLQFLLKLFPVSGSLVIISCPAQPQKNKWGKNWKGELSEM